MTTVATQLEKCTDKIFRNMGIDYIYYFSRSETEPICCDYEHDAGTDVVEPFDIVVAFTPYASRNLARPARTRVVFRISGSN